MIVNDYHCHRNKTTDIVALMVFFSILLIRGLYADTLSSLNLPIIPTFCNIANLIECVAMFYFIKGLSVFRIVTEPCTDRFLLFSGFPISLHHVLDVSGFGGRKD